MRCESCNTENENDAEYCAGCGERLCYDEAFFKRENNVDALPKLDDKVKPIRAFGKGGWRAPAVRRLLESLDAGEESERPRAGGKMKRVVVLSIVALLSMALFAARVLR
jgi:hypothetical protein